MKTQSEKWFEEFCGNVGLVCCRIDETNEKTPDYLLKVNDQKIIVEVKEFSRNPEEQNFDQNLEKHGSAGMADIPGARVRKKIKDSSKQIKARTQGTHPAILVLCDIQNGHGIKIDHTRPYDIMIGMYGIETIEMTIPRDRKGSPYMSKMSFGSNKSMTKNDNTSISAIGVLSTATKDDFHLDVYHNIYAAQPLDPILLSKYGIRQFRFVEQESADSSQCSGDWAEI